MATTMKLLQPQPLYPNGRNHHRPLSILEPARLISPRRHITALLLSAALILITLGFAWTALRTGNSDPADNGLIPAPVASPSPSQEATPSVDGLFDVGGHKLYIRCIGTGSPTLVFLNRLDQWTGYWGDIPADLAGGARVCVYDRANQGKSGHAPMSTAADSVADLHALLEAANVPGPYLLVGDNFGGLVATMYAGTYPDQVAGLVLLGPLHPWEDEIEGLIPASNRTALRDEHSSNREAVSYYASLDQELALLPKVGNIPVAVLVGDDIFIPDGWPAEQMTSRTYELYQRFADSFAQGAMIKLHTTAYIVEKAPDQVVTEVQKVIAVLQAP